MAPFVFPSFLLFSSLIYFFDFLTCCSAKLVNITVDNASDRIVYSPSNLWQMENGVPGAIGGTVSVTEVTDKTIVISLTFIGSAIYVVGNDSSKVQAFWPEVDGKDVEENPVLGNSTAASASLVPYWGIEGLSPNDMHELNLTLISGFTYVGKKRFLQPAALQPFFLDAIIYTQESADDDAPSASQPITLEPTVTSSGSVPLTTVGSDTAESKSVRTVPKSLIGGIVGGIVIVAIILAIAVTFFVKARRARGVQLCRKQSILSLPEHTQDIEPGAADMVPRPFSTAETTTSSSTFLTKSQLYSSSHDKVTQEMMLLRAEIGRLRGDRSLSNDAQAVSVSPPDYETPSATRFI